MQFERFPGSKCQIDSLIRAATELQKSQHLGCLQKATATSVARTLRKFQKAHPVLKSEANCVRGDCASEGVWNLACTLLCSLPEPLFVSSEQSLVSLRRHSRTAPRPFAFVSFLWQARQLVKGVTPIHALMNSKEESIQFALNVNIFP